MKYNISSSLCMVVVLGVVFCCISGASASSITLSDLSNNGSTPVADLGATVEFAISSTNLGDNPILTVTFTNTSLSPVQEILFNIPEGVSSVSLTTNPQNKWQVTAGEDAHSVASFGLFDLLLNDAPSGSVAKVGDGSFAIFGIQLFGGTGTISDGYFVDGSESTTVTGGETAVVVGAFFDVGNTSSAHGASTAVTVIPEPGTLALLAFSMFMVAIFRCRLC